MSDLYAIRKKYKTEMKAAEREYSRQAVDSVTGAIAAIDEAGLRPIRQALGDSAEQFTEDDVRFSRPSVLGMNPSNPTQPPEDVVLPAEGVNAAFDMAMAPTNLVGSGLFTAGLKTANKVGDIAGNTTSAARNYIDNFYAPSKTAQPTGVDKLIMQNQGSLSRVPKVGSVVSKLEKPQDSADMRERVGSFVGWMGDSGVRAINQTLSPSARANYRQNQVTQTMQDTARTALSTGGSRDTAKAVAQTQATENIANQAGRKGPKSEAVEDLNRRSFLTEPVKATEGAYRKLIKDNKLTGVYEKSGKPVGVSNKDLSVVEDHVMSVWKDRKGKKVSETPTADIRIKNPGSGDQVTGSHVLDFRQKSKVFKTMNALYKKNPKPTLEETWKHLNDSDIKLHPKSKTLEDARENGIWTTGSFSGNAITEGGVNFIAKVNPNGRVMAVISDEHNFLEKVPGLGPAVDAALPNRSISVTPPMFFDIKKTKGKIEAPQPQNKKNVKESLFDIANQKPSTEALRAEQAVNAGAGLVGAGMLTGSEEE